MNKPLRELHKKYAEEIKKVSELNVNAGHVPDIGTAFAMILAENNRRRGRVKGAKLYNIPDNLLNWDELEKDTAVLRA